MYDHATLLYYTHPLTLTHSTLHTYKQKHTTTTQEAHRDARRVHDGERRPTEVYCGLGLGVESERKVTTGNMRASSDPPASWSGGGRVRPAAACETWNGNI